MTTLSPLELEDTPLFEKVVSQGVGFADCECNHHGEGHTLPGLCGEKAFYRLTGKWIQQRRSPITVLLCKDCLQWYVEFLKGAHPDLLVSIREL